ncbi:hypothetical protein INR49_010121 [Caranx melampygus]|nr:hypothetical protein INR49_010121 [Caranx melampygus]
MEMLVYLSWMCVGGAMAKLHYMVAVPAVIEAGAETQFCASLLQPNETMVMTYSVIEMKDCSDNRIGQWLNENSNVLPKFDMKMNVPDEVSIGQEEFKAEVCLKYTYGQPVPGSVEMKICRPLERHERKNEAQCYEETKEVKAVNYNNIPIPDMVLYISEGRHSSARQVQSVTTDHDGIAAFSFNTTNYKQDILLYSCLVQH